MIDEQLLGGQLDRRKLQNQVRITICALLLDRDQWVRIRTRIQNALQAIALANGLRRGPSLWSYDGQAKTLYPNLSQ